MHRLPSFLRIGFRPKDPCRNRGVNRTQLIGKVLYVTWAAAVNKEQRASFELHQKHPGAERIPRTHPMAGATALIAVIGSDQVHALGYLYALIPAGTGAMLLIALAVNNLPRKRCYPEFWI